MYEKQNFKSGDKLKAAQLNAMDEQIASNASKLENLNAGEDGGYYIPSVDAAGNLTFTASKEGMPEVAGGKIMGPPGASVTVTNVTESTDDGGENVVSLSDGTRITVRNGRQGTPGKNGSDASVTNESIKKALGYTPANEKAVSQLSEEIENEKITMSYIAESKTLKFSRGGGNTT